jgi:hypothetical protein
MESKGEGAKLSQRWIGPFEVMQAINPKVYRLRMSSKYPGLPIFNIDHFKLYRDSPADMNDRVTLPETRTRAPAKAEYVVEKILAHRFAKKNGAVEFLVRWEGYGPQFDTWEPKTNLKNSPRILGEYLKDQDL